MVIIRDKSEFVGKYWGKRWELYLKCVADYVKGLNPERVLEIGTNGMSLCLEADTMDITGNPTFLHDATKPFPVDNKQYDLVIATQVWEHLGTGQREAFKEVMRVSGAAILSFPYLWRNKKNKVHYGIDKNKIDEWTCNMPYEIERITNIPKTHKRVIRVFKF